MVATGLSSTFFDFSVLPPKLAQRLADAIFLQNARVLHPDPNVRARYGDWDDDPCCAQVGLIDDRDDDGQHH